MEQIATLEVQNLCKRFGSNEVLKGINLTANKGDVVSIIGSSGSGNRRFCAVSICWKRRPVVMFMSMVS